jgi:hypothetical protein
MNVQDGTPNFGEPWTKGGMLVEMNAHEVTASSGATGSTVIEPLVLLPRGWLCEQPLGSSLCFSPRNGT